jgi:hypothetical protein
MPSPGPVGTVEIEDVEKNIGGDKQSAKTVEHAEVKS